MLPAASRHFSAWCSDLYAFRWALTLRDALRECDQRYPEPSNKNGSLLRGAFRTIRDDSPAGSLPTVYRLILAVILFLLPTFAYLFLYASGFATVRTVRWISHGFKKGMAP